MSKTQVIDPAEVKDVAEEPATIPDGGVAQPEATPAQPTVDVEQLQKQYETKLSASQADLDKLKSALQKREAELTKEYQQRERNLQEQLKQAKLSTMDEAQRAKYEEELKSEEWQSLNQQLNDAQQSVRESQEILNAMRFFISQGVPADRLVLDQGYNGVTESGWAYIREELETLRNAASKATQKPERKTAPDVVTDKSIPSKGVTWKQLRETYGSEEAVYQAIEQGLLDPSILPA